MKEGPSVRGSYKTSRASSNSALRLLVSSRGLATGHTPESRSPSGHHYSQTGSPLLQNLTFENCLPINLRNFLLSELGSRVYIDDSTIAPASGEAPEAFMRDLARAIRRFSFARAHESWIEVVSSRVQLEEGLIRSQTGAGQVVLCLTCERLSVGSNASSEHPEGSCVAVALNGGPAHGHDHERPGAVPFRRNLYREIANFRLSREEQGMPHSELDYYMRDNCYVFTWRPLPG